MRWGGSLLEEARVHGSPLLLTAAPHAVAAAPIAEVEIVSVTGAASDADRVVRVVETRPGGQRRACRWPTPTWSSPAGAASARPRASR